MRTIINLFRDEGGASVVELALAAPILATLLVGMIDLSAAYSTKLQTVQVAQRAIERVQVNAYKTSDKAVLQAEAAAAANVAESAVTVEDWLECNGAKKVITETCNAGEAYARYVSVTVAKVYKPIFSMKFAGANADGTYTIRGRAGVRVQ